MEEAIRESTLRILAFETPCDVTLSCIDRKFSAHKVILSIASPILQRLIVTDTSDPTMLIFPEIEGTVMKHIINYIYNGSVAISAEVLPDFIAVGNMLQLKIDPSFYKISESFSNTKKTDKKVPDLMPISLLRSSENTPRKKPYKNRVFPSPWCPRIVPLLAHPLEDCASISNSANVTISSHLKRDKCTIKNDTNNNSQMSNMPPTFQLTINNSSNVSYIVPRINSSTSPLNTPKYDDDKVADNKLTGIIIKEEIEKREDALSFVDVKIESKENELSSGKASETDEEAKKEQHKPFKCHDCGKSFSQLRNYKYHRSIHEGTKEFAAHCNECGKTFNDRGYLSSHMKIHRDRKEYACPECPKRFNQRVAYNMHLRIHTGLKPHECPTCGKGFSRKMLLKQHQRVHTGERPYSCPECGKSFADRSNMSLHARLHTGVKPYACNICSKSFTKKHHLKTHMNFHTGLKPYSCQKCGLSFSQSSNMRTHYKKCILKIQNNT